MWHPALIHLPAVNLPIPEPACRRSSGARARIRTLWPIALPFWREGNTRVLTNAAGTGGVTLASGANAWAGISDRNMKENIIELDYDSVLSRVNSLPIYTYNYADATDEDLRIGPMAQNWHLLFPSCKDPLCIDTVDLDGVKLACLKALSSRVDILKSEVKKMREMYEKSKMLKCC